MVKKTKTRGVPESRQWYKEHGMDYEDHVRGLAPRYSNIRLGKSYYTTPQTVKSSKIAAIDHYILQKYGYTSGTQLANHQEEFITRVRKAGIDYIDEKDAYELTNKNYHTALSLLAAHGMVKKTE